MVPLNLIVVQPVVEQPAELNDALVALRVEQVAVPVEPVAALAERNFAEFLVHLPIIVVKVGVVLA